MSKAISCIEVKDDKEFIGNTMCFLAEINGKPALVLDNIEMRMPYQYNDEIRDKIFEYAKQLTKEISDKPMDIYAGPNRHKVFMNEYDLTNVEFKIIGLTKETPVYIDTLTDDKPIDPNTKHSAYLYKIT